MARYVALLRGISPLNATMAGLRAAFEAGGFGDVQTVLATGNVLFDAKKANETQLARRCEKVMEAHLGRSFFTIVRPLDDVRAMIEEDRFRAHRIRADEKRVVSFLAEAPKPVPKLPIERDDARVLAIHGLTVFSVYAPNPKAGAFMVLLERTFGKTITTRTWDTVKRIASK